MGSLLRFLKQISFSIKRLMRIKDNFYENEFDLLFEHTLKGVTQKDNGVKKILEVGGIDRPKIKRNTENENYLIIDGLDIDYRQGCDVIYSNFYHLGIEKMNFENTYDFVYSFTVLEHIEDNEIAVSNIYKALKEGGITMHYMPSKLHPFTLINRMLPNKIAKLVLKYLRPEIAGVTGYKSYYDFCTPDQMKKLFSKKGFTDVSTVCYYDASDYFAFFPPIYFLVICYESIIKKLALKNLCAGFIVVAKK